MNFLSRRKATRGQKNEITTPLFFLCHHEGPTHVRHQQAQPDEPIPSQLRCAASYARAPRRLKREKKSCGFRGCAVPSALLLRGTYSRFGNYWKVTKFRFVADFRGFECRDRFLHLGVAHNFIVLLLEICMSGSLRNPNCGSTFPFPAISHQMGHEAWRPSLRWWWCAASGSSCLVWSSFSSSWAWRDSCTNRTPTSRGGPGDEKKILVFNLSP